MFFVEISKAVTPSVGIELNRTERTQIKIMTSRPSDLISRCRMSTGMEGSSYHFKDGYIGLQSPVQCGGAWYQVTLTDKRN
jgi:hypothetical protein